MRCIILSHEASRALDLLYDYTVERWGIAQARKYLERIQEGFDTLAEYPQRGRKHADIPNPYKVYSVGKHLIVYHAQRNHIAVLTVLHHAMDIRLRMKEALQRAKNPLNR